MTTPIATVVTRGWMLLALAGALAAQRTWIVDWQNRPGTHFTDLPPALAAATDGDTIVVQGPGGPAPYAAYTGARITRGITLLGVNAPRLVAASGYDLFTASGIAANRTLVIKGFASCPLFVSLLTLELCDGRIVIEDVGAPAGATNALALEVRDCANVTITRGRFGLLPGMTYGYGAGLRCQRSVVALTDCSVGGDAAQLNFGGHTCFVTPGAPAVAVSDSLLTLAGGSCVGGDGASCGASAAAGRPALVQTGGLVQLLGDTTTAYRSGGSPLGPAIQTDGGTLRYGSDLQFTAQGPPIVGTSQVTSWQSPYLSGAGQPAGNSVALGLWSQAGEVVVLFGGFPDAPLPVLPLGLWWLPNNLLIATGVVGANRRWQLTLPVPPGIPDGLPFAFQGVTATLATVALSNPVGMALH